MCCLVVPVILLSFLGAKEISSSADWLQRLVWHRFRKSHQRVWNFSSPFCSSSASRYLSLLWYARTGWSRDKLSRDKLRTSNSWITFWIFIIYRRVTWAEFFKKSWWGQNDTVIDTQYVEKYKRRPVNVGIIRFCMEQFGKLWTWCPHPKKTESSKLMWQGNNCGQNSKLAAAQPNVLETPPMVGDFT